MLRDDRRIIKNENLAITTCCTRILENCKVPVGTTVLAGLAMWLPMIYYSFNGYTCWLCIIYQQTLFICSLYRTPMYKTSCLLCANNRLPLYCALSIVCRDWSAKFLPRKIYSLSHNFLNWCLALRSFYSSLYVRCILSWGRAFGTFGGFSTRQLTPACPIWKEKRKKEASIYILSQTEACISSKINNSLQNVCYNAQPLLRQ